MNAAAARNIDESRPARRAGGAVRPVRLPAPPPATTSTVWLARLAHRGVAVPERRAAEHPLGLGNPRRHPGGGPGGLVGRGTPRRRPGGGAGRRPPPARRR